MPFRTAAFTVIAAVVALLAFGVCVVTPPVFLVWLVGGGLVLARSLARRTGWSLGSFVASGVLAAGLAYGGFVAYALIDGGEPPSGSGGSGRSDEGS